MQDRPISKLRGRSEEFIDLLAGEAHGRKAFLPHRRIAPSAYRASRLTRTAAVSVKPPNIMMSNFIMWRIIRLLLGRNW